MSRAELIASLRADAAALQPKRAELENARLDLANRLEAVHSELQSLGQRYSDLHTAAQALEALK